MQVTFSEHLAQLIGGLPLKPPKYEHMFLAAITFLPYILCGLRWYVKHFYMHYFLEDTSKKVSVTKKFNPPNCGNDNSPSKVPGI